MNTSRQAARGLADLQAFLYREAHLSAARRRVSAFTAKADGLTQGQRVDLERWYLEEQKYVARMVTEHIAERIGAAEAAHRLRFGRWLRGTLIAMTAIGLTIFVCTAVVVGSMA
ncbi:hypothetical protein [Streptomyces rubrogriseus]|uniref:Uncharacterized protein n=1 Tax=Streptomyces rubrogriseus TaxID=194673 RepID=A0A6G3TJQ2_9ACTN|nr:hypothetical protein [Streptomyces rubrogriseus]NEC36685.1 hypothetical protein [Streptomyces rubrogriseus]